MKETRKFVFEKDTKNMRRYLEQRESGKASFTGQSGVLYLNKEVVNGATEVTVTVETAESTEQ